MSEVEHSVTFSGTCTLNGELVILPRDATPEEPPAMSSTPAPSPSLGPLGPQTPMAALVTAAACALAAAGRPVTLDAVAEAVGLPAWLLRNAWAVWPVCPEKETDR